MVDEYRADLFESENALRGGSGFYSEGTPEEEDNQAAAPLKDNTYAEEQQEVRWQDLAPLDSRSCALIAARAADSKKALDLMVQEVKDLIGVTDYFVIATASNSRQVEAIIDEIEEKCRLQGHVKPLHREGTNDGNWALLDFGSFVVHVFSPEARDYYRLEALWNDAPIINLEEEAGIENLSYSERIAALLEKSTFEEPSVAPEGEESGKV